MRSHLTTKVNSGYYRTFLLLLVMLLMIGVATIPWHVKWWPAGYTKFHVYLWLKKNEIASLLALAEETPYQRIFWIDATTVNGHEMDMVIEVDVYDQDNVFQRVDNPDIAALVAVAEEAEIVHFYLINEGGAWAFQGYHNHWMDSSGFREVQVISSYQQRRGELPGERCSNALVDSLEVGECYTKLFGDWVMRKTWFWIESDQTLVPKN